MGGRLGSDSRDDRTAGKEALIHRALNHSDYTWTTDSVSNICVVTALNTLNPGSNQPSAPKMAGFGRGLRVETGHDTTTVSQADTQYAACACSPLGKLWRVSQPYAPGGTPIWTTYAYDGSGRTVSVTLPDSSATTTQYLTVY